MATIQQEIVDAIEVAMQDITTANGYNTDIGANVFVWPSNALTKEELPCVIIRDMSSPVLTRLQGGNARRVHRELNVEISVMALPGTLPDDEFRKMIADVLAALGANETLGVAEVERIEIDGHEPELDQEEKILTGATISFRVMYWATEFTI